MAADPTRRRVLAAAGLAALTAGAAGCAPGHPWPWATPPSQSPDVGVLKDAIAAEDALISRYITVIAALPALAATAAPLLGQHREHLAQLRGRLVVPAGAPASATAGARPPRQPALPSHDGRAAALGYLRDAELDQAALLTRDLATVRSPSFAQLLASVAASEAAHAALLQQAGGRR